MPRDIAQAVEECRSTRLTGWQLVDYATRLVSERFSTYSVLHPWEPPASAFRHGRGFCTQYNGALRLLLQDLGFRPRLVYAARVRFPDAPNWRLGHTWIRLTLGGEQRDVCARSSLNAAGRVGLEPLTPVREAHRVLTFFTTTGSFVAAVTAIAHARLRRRARPYWVEHPRDGP